MNIPDWLFYIMSGLSGYAIGTVLFHIREALRK